MFEDARRAGARGCRGCGDRLRPAVRPQALYGSSACRARQWRADRRLRQRPAAVRYGAGEVECPECGARWVAGVDRHSKALHCSWRCCVVRAWRSGSSSSHDRAACCRGNRPTPSGTVVAWPARATMASGRGPARSALAEPVRRSGPPPPTSAMPSARHGGCTARAAASRDSTVIRSRRPPTARGIAAIQERALPSSFGVADRPEVSMTTKARGGVRRRLGSTAPGTPPSGATAGPWV